MSGNLSIALPLVSIVITSYNREKTIARAIESALAQDYPNLEIIVSDNCSTDNSDEVINRYTGDPRIRYTVNETNVGMLENFRQSIVEKAKGTYFSIVNSDDEYINPRFISQCVQLILENNNVVLVKGGSYHKVGDTGKYHTYKANKSFEDGWEYFKQFRLSEDFGWAGILIERKYIEMYNLLASNTLMGVDYFINLRLCLSGNIGFVKEPSYQFNLHGTNGSLSAHSLPQIDEIFSALDELFKFAEKEAKMTTAELDDVRRHYQYAYVVNILEDYYRNNRKLLPMAEQKLRTLTGNLVTDFYRSKRWKANVIVYKNKKMGNFIVNLKWKLNNLLSKGNK